MTKTTVTPFNMLDYLTTSAMIDAYVAEAYASGDAEYIAEALETAAIARGRGYRTQESGSPPDPEIGGLWRE
jgi:DNA-binding phage protein